MTCWLLRHACKSNNTDEMQRLLDGGVDLAAQGEVPLFIASERGHVAAAKMLLDHGSDVDRTSEYGVTPVAVACRHGHIEVATLLLDRGANIDPEDFEIETPLYFACWNGQTDAARFCLDRGAYVDRISRNNIAPLSIASLMGHVGPARLCIERGANLYRQDDFGRCPEEIAHDNRRLAMAAWLGRIKNQGWTTYLSEPRYELVVLRSLAARGLARRKRADPGKEQLLDFLFPSCQPPRRARRGQPHLPDDLFVLIARYYWGGGLSAEEEAAAAAEAHGGYAAETSEDSE